MFKFFKKYGVAKMDIITVDESNSEVPLSSSSSGYVDSRFYRRDKELIPLGKPTTKYRKCPLEIPEWE